MSDFALEPWEVPPGVEAQRERNLCNNGAASLERKANDVRHEVGSFEHRRESGVFRPDGGNINYVLLDRDVDNNWKISVHKAKVPQTKISERLSYWHGEYAFGRVFYVGDACCVIDVERGAHFQNKWPFTPFHVPFDAMNELSARVFDWLKQQWKNAESEMRFAWNWNRWSEEENLAFYGGCAPYWSELFELMRDAARSELLPEDDHWHINEVDSSDEWDADSEVEKRIHRWGNAFKTHFLPGFERLQDAPSYVLEDFDLRLQNVYIYGEDVSHHERIEARLRLREWLQQNAPDRLDLLPMNDFKLQPWEEAIRFQGEAPQPECETDELHLACVPVSGDKWILLGREKARPETGNWIVLDLYHPQPRTWSPKALPFALKGVAAGWSSYAKGRAFAWPDKRFILRKNGEGAWLDEELRADIPFDLKVEANVWNHSALLQRQIQRELSDDEADINFAVGWNMMAPDARDKFYGGSASHAQLQKLAQFVLMQLPQLCVLDEVTWRISKSFPTIWKLSSGGNPIEANQWLRCWSHFLAFDYLPKVTQAGRDKHGALEKFDGYIGSYFEAMLHPPTHHEQLEARLRLREWLERNAPDRMDLLPP